MDYAFVSAFRRRLLVREVREQPMHVPFFFGTLAGVLLVLAAIAALFGV